MFSFCQRNAKKETESELNKIVCEWVQVKVQKSESEKIAKELTEREQKLIVDEQKVEDEKRKIKEMIQEVEKEQKKLNKAKIDC